MLFLEPRDSKQHLNASAVCEKDELLSYLALSFLLKRCDIKTSSLFAATVSFVTRLTLRPSFYSPLTALRKLSLTMSAVQIKLSSSPPHVQIAPDEIKTHFIEGESTAMLRATDSP